MAIADAAPSRPIRKTGHHLRSAWARAQLCSYGVASVAAGVFGAVAAEGVPGASANPSGPVAAQLVEPGEPGPACTSGATWPPFLDTGDGPEPAYRSIPSSLGTPPGAEAPPRDSLETPALLQSAPYSVVRLLGKGAYGTVHLINCRGHQLAVKVFETDETGVRADCLREIAYLRQCAHPHVLAAQRPVIHGGLVYLFVEAMEYDLGAPCHRTPAPAQRRRLMGGVASGLAHVHALHLMHRDLKPANILVSRAGEAKLADFGLARTWTPGRAYTLLVCTRWYRAPELLLLDQQYSQAVDVWALGLILIELATGRACLRGATDDDQLTLVVRAFGRPTHSTWPGVERLAGYPRVRGHSSPVATPRCAQRLVDEAQLTGDEAAVALGALRYDPSQRMHAHEAAALLGDPVDPPETPRGDGAPGRGALAHALRRAAAARGLGREVVRVAGWVTDRFVHTPGGAAYLAAAGAPQVDLLARVAVSIAAKADGCDAVWPADGGVRLERQVLRAVDFQLPRGP